MLAGRLKVDHGWDGFWFHQVGFVKEHVPCGKSFWDFPIRWQDRGHCAFAH